MILRKSIFVLFIAAIMLLSGCSGGKDVMENLEEEPNTAVEESTNQTVEVESLFDIKRTAGMVSIDDEIFISTGAYEQVNMTLVISEKEGTLIDAGMDIDEGEKMKKFVDKNEIVIKNIIVTHRHADHTRNLSMFNNDEVNVYDFDNTEDEQVIEMGKHKMVILHTPGHFEDRHQSVELNGNILIAGDVINSSIDPKIAVTFGGNVETLIKTLERLKEKSYDLIIPGHGKVVEGNTIIEDHIEKLKAE